MLISPKFELSNSAAKGLMLELPTPPVDKVYFVCFKHLHIIHIIFIPYREHEAEEKALWCVHRIQSCLHLH